jgi:transcriptional regulator with XRE-family HTH domain
MKRFSYRQRDDAFGQSMLALRTSLRLTQAGLAERLHVSRRAVRGWEAGHSYPQAHHLQHVITLAVQQPAFPLGREEEEIRVLWQAVISDFCQQSWGQTFACTWQALKDLMVLMGQKRVSISLSTEQVARPAAAVD